MSLSAESNRKTSIADAINKIWNSPSTVSIESIKSCPYLLPCGFCDRTGILCSQYESNMIGEKSRLENY